MKTLFDLAQKLDRKKLTSRQLVEHCLANIEAQDGEGQRAFISVYRERSLAEADAADAARSESRHTSPFSGIPISVKDLFDVAGQITTAGSHVLDEQPPASHDAIIVQRLRSAGFIIIGKTNMTEFAYSGLGVNAHYGTPANPYEREVGRIPGGSSSGAAVSVTDNMAAGGIGTDTGGSTRIPAALCGIVGFKPTAERVSQQGCVPLSTSLDSIGPMANTVTCCAVLDSIIAGDNEIELAAHPQVGIRLGVLDGFAMEDLDSEVAEAYLAALDRLGKRGILTKTINLPELESYNAHINRGSLIGGEAYAWHKPFLHTRREHYDPWVRERIDASHSFTAADYVETVERRRQCQNATFARLYGLDAMVLPTVPILARPIDSMKNDDESRLVNGLNLRNTSIANTLNAPAISIPCHKPDSAPVGFMLIGTTGEDKRLLSLAQCLEPIIRRDR